MKKRLFITSALMTVVLGASLATGTYAWYKAAEGNTSVTAGTVSVSTADNTYTVGAITFTLSLTNSGTPDLVNAEGKTFYYSGTTLVEDTANTKIGTLTLAVTAAIGGTTATATQLSAYAGTYNVTITDDQAANKILFSIANTTVEHDYPKFHLSMRCYICSLLDEKIELIEHSAAKWLSVNELETVDWLPADVKIIDIIKANLKN